MSHMSNEEIKRENTHVPAVVIARLPIYLRVLERLNEGGKEITSSQDLGRRLGISSAQIRKDLSFFGEFGKQGTGYNVSFLHESLRQILQLNSHWNVVLIGYGDLGKAIVSYDGFKEQGFFIKWIFDNDPHKIGQPVMDHPHPIQTIENLTPIIKQEKIQIAILAVPRHTAQEIAEYVVHLGIRAILNYAPITLHLPAEVQVQNIDPISHLQQMTYYLDVP